MSRTPKDTGIQHHQEHGTVRSYIIGFLLSLTFTFIPYYLVVNQVITGTYLLWAILVFAVLQLFVQVIFFLHLGRGPKPNWNLHFLIGTVATILVVVGASIFIINNLTYNMLPTEQAKKLINDEGITQIEGTETGGCNGQHETHKVIIKESRARPQYTYAKECDVLLFVNQDKGVRNIVFGEHPDRDVYAGENLLIISDRRSNSLILSEVGTYQFYDELNPSTSGFFIVEE